MGFQILKNSEIRKLPIHNRLRTNIYLEKEIVEYLKRKALELNTTSSEIIRAAINEFIRLEGDIEEIEKYKIFFETKYGIRTIDKDGNIVDLLFEKHDTPCSTINEAKRKQRVLFDEVVEEMRVHNKSQRAKEQAYSYICAISERTENNPNGTNAYDRLDDDQKEILNASRLTFNGSDF